MSALVAVVSHELANTTQYLGALNALLALDGVGPATHGALGGLAPTSREVDDLGFVLALVSQACGADLMGSRREVDGLRPFVKRVVDAARRAGRRPEWDPASTPRLAPDPSPHAWRVPWAIGRWIHGAAVDAGATRVRFRVDTDGAFVLVSGANVERAALDALESALASFDARVRFADVQDESGARCRALALPAGSLLPPTTAPGG